jgi:competence protein ComEC
MKFKIFSVLAAVVYLFTIFVNDMQRSGFQVYFLDVGQGDAIFIRNSGDVNILVDGGPESIVLSKLGSVLPPWIRKIDIVVLTHPHSDHIQGLIEVLQRYEIKEVWFNSVVYHSDDYNYWLELLADLENIRGLEVRAVDTDYSAITKGLQIRVLWPKKAARSSNSIEGECGKYMCRDSFNDNINNDSIVLLISFKDLDILLMGDVEHEVEDELLSDIRHLDEIEILKAGHHCSRTASGKRFLELLDPDLAICSLGADNKFGHPHEEAIENFDILGISYLRTDEKGNIAIRSFDRNYSINY